MTYINPIGAGSSNCAIEYGTEPEEEFLWHRNNFDPADDGYIRPFGFSAWFQVTFPPTEVADDEVVTVGIVWAPITDG